MRSFEHIYINGRFVTPTGTEWLDIIKPADGSVIGKARLADENDALQAIARFNPQLHAQNTRF